MDDCMYKNWVHVPGNLFTRQKYLYLIGCLISNNLNYNNNNNSNNCITVN